VAEVAGIRGLSGRERAEAVVALAVDGVPVRRLAVALGLTPGALYQQVKNTGAGKDG
jgi:hypothetical protein